ncbi:MAG TPA: bifunctional UDP-sugar hydrolase/5'-nucleotidase [Fimbriimonas sp.]|nr:bifunctional UDP-sugar hydrolase/5'-nucleotidase [Fimbriimonas sp.]
MIAIAKLTSTKLAAVVALALLGAISLAQDVKLTILHTNDTHGHLLPYSYPDVFNPGSDLALLKDRHDIGGAARRSTLVHEIRAEKGHETLLIDAGDICDGTPLSVEYHGDADVAAMNAIGYDFACPGNHEFNNTLDQVRHLQEEAKFPMVSANTVDAGGRSVYPRYVIRQVGGVWIAVFGLLTYDAHTYPAAKQGLRMEQPIDAARELVPELRKKADIVIAVTHIGVDEDEKLAAEVPGIDVIVGGHSHTLLSKPVLIPHLGDKTPNSIHGTLVVQDFQWAGTLGRLDLTLHHQPAGGWTVSKYMGSLLPVTKSVPEDPSVVQVVSKFWDPIAAKYGVVVGQADGDFAEKGSDLAEYNLVCDAVREQIGVDFDIENMGGVRATLPKGPVTFGDLATVDPFGDKIVTFHATGKQIKAILVKEMPPVSGIRYTVDDGKLTSATIDDKPIEDDRVYFGATNDYYAKFILKGIADQTVTNKPRLETTIAYIRKHATIRPCYDGRRVIKGDSASPPP